MSVPTPRISSGPFRRALVIESPDPSLDDHLRAAGIEPVRPSSTPTEDELARLLEAAPYQLLFKRSRVRVTSRVLDAAPELAAVVLCCIGDDSVDKRACAERGVLVINDPVSNGRSVVELVFGALICLSRRVFDAVRETDAHRFLKSQDARYELLGKTLGVFGLGRIGKQVAQLGESLGMRIAFHDNRDVACEVGETLGWRYAPSIRDLFAMSDYVTAHISAEDYAGTSNENVLRYEHFVAMSEKEHDSPRIFINLARGHVHSSEDLLRAVDDGHVRSALVDVFPQEPEDKSTPWKNPYANHPRIFGTPHIGAATLEAQPRIARHVAQSAHLLSAQGALRNCVFGPKHVVSLDDLSEVSHLLTVVHSTQRGTKKAVDDAIYNAGASNLVSVHRDFNEYGIAYDVSALDKPLTDEQMRQLVSHATEISRDPTAIRAIRQIRVGPTGD